MSLCIYPKPRCVHCRLFGLLSAAQYFMQSAHCHGAVDRVHVGDMANLVYCCAIDSESSVTAPVRLEDHALIGAAAVMMPGTTVGKGSTLGAMAASLPGAQLPGGHSPPDSVRSFDTFICK